MSARDLSAEDIDIALSCFAIEGGREKPTKKLLKGAGIKVSMGTLRRWAYDTYKERYWQLKVEAEKLVGTQLADTFQRLADESTELSEEALTRLRNKLTKHDREVREIEDRLAECEVELKEVNTAVGVAQVRLADSLEIPNVDALLEQVLGENPEKADSELVAELTQLYRRRDSLVNESSKLWDRRERRELSFQDLTKILHEAGVQGGIATEKLQLLTGGATERVEHSFPELQRALEAKGIRLAVGQGAPRALPAPVPIDSKPAK